ncbi:3D domain-containing protein [Marinobacterium sp. YM272]|uniref:3D domain-containing protein n=1 Tax=Marinobacterium sp. YM272 TaxID=3421654 RepID=UPI003D7FE041
MSLTWLLASSPAHSTESGQVKLQVKASAYNSVPEQTNDQPSIAAWGDELRPGMKVVAVSRDLLRHHGLTYGTEVRIEGLKGRYVVMDKMNKRWSRKIDIYMGENVEAALNWGVREVTITWQAPAAES